MIIAGPTADYLPLEIDAIRKYLRSGGKALFLLDPPIGSTRASHHRRWKALLKEWDITMGHDVVLDVSGMGQMLGTDCGGAGHYDAYPHHPITEDFTMLTAYPACAIGERRGGRESRPSASLQDLIKTSDRSWSEADMKSLASAAAKCHSTKRPAITKGRSRSG